MKTQFALLEAGNQLQFTDENNDITYCVETINDKVDSFEIEFSAWRDDQEYNRVFFASIQAFEMFCKNEEMINISDFRLYSSETDEYID